MGTLTSSLKVRSKDDQAKDFAGKDFWECLFYELSCIYYKGCRKNIRVPSLLCGLNAHLLYTKAESLFAVGDSLT